VQPVRLAYVVSRFPHVSETFILRELNALDADPELEIELGSLFPAVDATVHEAAEPWLGRLHRPGVTEGLRGVAWWLLRRPLRLAGSLAAMTRRPRRRSSCPTRVVPAKIWLRQSG